MTATDIRGPLTVNGLTDIGRWTLAVDSSAGKDAKPAVDNLAIISNTTQEILFITVNN